MSIGIVNYNAGNLTSVVSALNYIGADFFVSSDADKLYQADKIIFPGVGEASYAMAQLKATNCDKMLIEFASSKRPLLGICLGAQILFEHSQENDTKLLSILQGKVKRFNLPSGFKVPHMGWNPLKFENVASSNATKIFESVRDNSSFYFVHSYYMEPKDSKICVGSCDYGKQFCAACCSDNIFALQFHPEKSATSGLQILKNFMKL